MSRKQHLVIGFCVIFLLVGCNRPQTPPLETQKNMISPTRVTDTPVKATKTPESDQSTPEIQVTETVLEPTQDNTPPLEPTVDMTQTLDGIPISIYPAGTEVTLTELFMVDQNTGWAIGGVDPDYYHIFLTTDGGRTWQDVSPPQPGIEDGSGYVYVEFANWDALSAWVAYSGADYIWETDDGGITWKASLISFTTTVDGMFEVLDDDHIWFLQFLEGGMQKVYTTVNRSTDGGKTWELLLDPYDDITIQAFTKTGLDFINPQYGWLTRDFRGVDPFVRLNFSTDGGSTWDAWELPPPPSLPDLFQVGLADLFDPYLIAPGKGYFRLFSRIKVNEEIVDQEFLYQTSDSGANWKILEIPQGDLYYINEQVIYSISRDIHRSDDRGETWQFIKSVNWDGDFSFIDENTALGVAYDPDDDEYALVKTTDGFNSIEIVTPQVITSQTTR